MRNRAVTDLRRIVQKASSKGCTRLAGASNPLFRSMSVLLIGAMLLSACDAGAPAEETVSEEEASASEGAAPEEATSPEEAEPEEEGPSASFTIQADEEVQPAVAALYNAMYPGEEPAYVEDGADLQVLAVASPALDVSGGSRAYLLPWAFAEVQADNAGAAAFIDFATSPDGQQALIEEGLLPPSITLTDQAGREVTIPQPLHRVVVPYGPAVYFLYGVGAEDRIIAANYLGGRSEAAQATMTRIDPRFPEIYNDSIATDELNLEEVAGMAPDVIITNPRSPWVENVMALGIPVFLVEGETPERIQETMRLMGRMFGPNSAARADAWVNYYNSALEAIATQTESVGDEDRVRVLFTGTEPLRVASGEMLQSAIIEAAGGVSVSAELTGYWNDVNLEQIVLWEPDVIFVPQYGGASIEAITDSPEWQTLEAVQAGRVYLMPKLVAPWDTPTPDSVLAVIWTAQTLYPDLVELDCATEVDYFYQTFYDYDISEEEVVSLCGS